MAAFAQYLTNIFLHKLSHMLESKWTMFLYVFSVLANYIGKHLSPLKIWYIVQSLIIDSHPDMIGTIDGRLIRFSDPPEKVE